MSAMWSCHLCGGVEAGEMPLEGPAVCPQCREQVGELVQPLTDEVAQLKGWLGKLALAAKLQGPLMRELGNRMKALEQLAAELGAAVVALQGKEAQAVLPDGSLPMPEGWDGDWPPPRLEFEQAPENRIRFEPDGASMLELYDTNIKACLRGYVGVRPETCNDPAVNCLARCKELSDESTE